MSIKIRLFKNNNNLSLNNDQIILKKTNETIENNEEIYGIDFIPKDTLHESDMPAIKFYKDEAVINNNKISFNNKKVDDINVNESGASGLSEKYYINNIISIYRNQTLSKYLKDAFRNLLDNNAKSQMQNMLDCQGKEGSAFAYLKAYKNSL